MATPMSAESVRSLAGAPGAAWPAVGLGLKDDRRAHEWRRPAAPVRDAGEQGSFRDLAHRVGDGTKILAQDLGVIAGNLLAENDIRVVGENRLE